MIVKRTVGDAAAQGASPAMAPRITISANFFTSCGDLARPPTRSASVLFGSE